MSGPFGQMTAEQKTAASSAFALGRIGEPTDTAGVVAFLASEDAGFVTGQVIYNAGGQRGAHQARSPGTARRSAARGKGDHRQKFTPLSPKFTLCGSFVRAADGIQR
jgi:hypothetical protein